MTLSADDNTLKPAGSFAQSFTINTVGAHFARGNLGLLNAPISGMADLDPLLRGLLAVSPILPGIFSPIPMTWQVHKTGGKKEVLILLTVSLSGLATLTIASALFDLTKVNSADWQFAVLFLAGLQIGFGSGCFQLIIDTLKWTPKAEHIPNYQLLHSFLTDISSVIAPLVIFGLRPWGFYAPYSLLSGFVLISASAMLFGSQPSPFNQYLSAYSFDQAKELALAAGQVESTIVDRRADSLLAFVKANAHLLLDRRGAVLVSSSAISLGNFLIAKTFFPVVLTQGYGFEGPDALATNLVSIFLSLCARAAAAKITARWDAKSGGVKVHMAGCTITLLSSLSLAIFTMPQWAIGTCVAGFGIGYGITSITPVSIGIAWSKPANQQFKEFNPSPLFSLFNSVGGIGGILLTLVLSLMAKALEAPGYQHYFYVVAACSLISLLSVPLVNYQVQHKKKPLFGSPISFFRGNPQEPVEDVQAIEMMEQGAIPVNPRRHYVDAII